MALNLKSLIPKVAKQVSTGLTSIAKPLNTKVDKVITPDKARVIRNVGTALAVAGVGSVLAPVLATPTISAAVGRGALLVGKTAIKNPKTTLVGTSGGLLLTGILSSSPKSRSFVGENLGNVVKSPYLAGREIGGFIEGTEDTISKGTGAKVGGVLGGVLGAVAGAGAVYGYDKLTRDDEIPVLAGETLPTGKSTGSDEVLGDNAITDNSPQAMVTEKSGGVSKKRKKKIKPSANPTIRLTNNNYINIKNSVKGWN